MAARLGRGSNRPSAPLNNNEEFCPARLRMCFSLIAEPLFVLHNHAIPARRASRTLLPTSNGQERDMLKNFGLPALLLGAVLALVSPAAALAQGHGGGGRGAGGGHASSGGGGHAYSGRAYSGGAPGGARGYSGG